MRESPGRSALLTDTCSPASGAPSPAGTHFTSSAALHLAGDANCSGFCSVLAWDDIRTLVRLLFSYHWAAAWVPG